MAGSYLICDSDFFCHLPIVPLDEIQRTGAAARRDVGLPNFQKKRKTLKVGKR
jgi:hypothetical protein